MNVLIVHAHHEPLSFSSALSRQAAETLCRAGHEVVVSDLYRDGFDPVSDRRNFTTTRDATYLKQQQEELEATAKSGFAPELEAEIRKLERCDLLIFSFPLWWFGMPAILKGWVDRAFPMGRIYGQGRFYENGIGQGRKRALTILTTGGPPDAYNGYGVNTPMETLLGPIQHGIFWFNGFLPLDPFIAWSPAHISDQQRQGYLKQLDARLRAIEQEAPRRLPPLSDFPGFGKDTNKRFLVTATRTQAPDQSYLDRAPAEARQVAALKRDGLVLSSYVAAPEAKPWRAFLVFRETSPEAVRGHLDALPLAGYLNFEITELTPA